MHVLAVLPTIYKIPNPQHTFECNTPPVDSHMLLKTKTCEIWNCILKTWCELNYEVHMYVWGKITNQVIWLKSNIRVNGKPIWNSKWYAHGVVYLHDFIDQQNHRFLTLIEFQGKFNIRCQFLEYMSEAGKIQ